MTIARFDISSGWYLVDHLYSGIKLTSAKSDGKRINTEPDTVFFPFIFYRESAKGLQWNSN